MMRNYYLFFFVLYDCDWLVFKCSNPSSAKAIRRTEQVTETRGTLLAVIHPTTISLANSSSDSGVAEDNLSRSLFLARHTWRVDLRFLLNSPFGV